MRHLFIPLNSLLFINNKTNNIVYRLHIGKSHQIFQFMSWIYSNIWMNRFYENWLSLQQILSLSLNQRPQFIQQFKQNKKLKEYQLFYNLIQKPFQNENDNQNIPPNWNQFVNKNLLDQQNNPKSDWTQIVQTLALSMNSKNNTKF